MSGSATRSTWLLAVVLAGSGLLGGCWLDFGEPLRTIVENGTTGTVEIFFDREVEEVLYRELEPGALTSLGPGCSDEPMVARSLSGEEIDRIVEGEVCEGQVWLIGAD